MKKERRSQRSKKETERKGEGGYGYLRGRGGGEGGGADLLGVLNACILPSVLFIWSSAHKQISSVTLEEHIYMFVYITEKYQKVKGQMTQEPIRNKALHVFILLTQQFNSHRDKDVTFGSLDDGLRHLKSYYTTCALCVWRLPAFIYTACQSYL